MLAAGQHVAARYGGLRPKEHPYRGGLAPSQERRAKKLLRDDLAGDVPLAAVARDCGLSLSPRLGISPGAWRRSMHD